ncbi:iron-siderophore ABC transporter substrate-binding protein [Paenibacillus hodogayensis]|uniref:Iron-siderophore ABC transporter substrate-binding protein n=1 Tax=Paenibacillus hodogayensis TaxID=279208 RepID=A0ABV5VY00_9BACL
MVFGRTGSTRRAAALLAVIVLACVVLSACGSAKSAAPAEEGTRTIKHAMGESVVPAHPQRVVILTNEGTEALLALGVKPIAAVDSFYGNPWYEHIAADMAGVKNIGGESQPNLEIIASLKPDLILGNKMRQEKLYEQLKAIAPTVFTETLRGEWKSNFQVYADALNLKEKGEQVVAAFDKRMDDFKSKAGDKLNEKVAVVRFMGGKTRFYYGNMFSGVIFNQLGVKRSDPQSDSKAFEDITKERLPELGAADIVFYFTYDLDGKGKKQEEEWINDPLWKNLKVVQNNKVYAVNDATWNTSGGVKAANLMLDDLYKIYKVAP